MIGPSLRTNVGLRDLLGPAWDRVSAEARARAAAAGIIARVESGVTEPASLIVMPEVAAYRR